MCGQGRYLSQELNGQERGYRMKRGEGLGDGAAGGENKVGKEHQSHSPGN